MIVPMKKITVLCLAEDRDAALEDLRELGAVHVVDVRPPAGEDVDMARAQLDTVSKALAELRTASAAQKSEKSRRLGRRSRKEAATEREAQPGVTTEAVPVPEDAASVGALVRSAVDERRAATERAEAARRELTRMAGFGEVDPDQLQSLAAHGIHVRLGVAPPKAAPTAPEGFVLESLGSDSEAVRFALIGCAPFDLDDVDLGVSCQEVRPPEAATVELRHRIEQAQQDIEACSSRLASLAVAIDSVDRYAGKLREAERFVSVGAGMGREHVVCYLQGYAPSESISALEKQAEQRGRGLLAVDPEPGDDVPVLLRYSRVVRPIRGVLDFLKIYPSYWEADIGWTFLVFFSIFFAMLAGDAVYGTFLLLCSVALQLKFRQRIPGYLYGLMYIVSSLTIVWGVMTGSYVGISNLPGFLESLRVPWLLDRDHVIELCFIIGAVHLTIAHVWNAITVRPRSKALAQVGWIMIVWTMLLLARTMVLGYPMPRWILYVFAVGAVLVAGFMATPTELKKSFVDHALLPLTIISSFVDVLSYVRLFAVGYASVAVVSAFNMMASQIGFDSVPRAIGAALVIAIANALNLVLIALAVLVHAVRLNTLEFSTHKGISWQGQPYAPFARSNPVSAGSTSGA